MICDLCGLAVSGPMYFTEYYDPQKDHHHITYCCTTCQMKICSTIDRMKVRV